MSIVFRMSFTRRFDAGAMELRLQSDIRDQRLTEGVQPNGHSLNGTNSVVYIFIMLRRERRTGLDSQPSVEIAKMIRAFVYLSFSFLAATRAAYAAFALFSVPFSGALNSDNCAAGLLGSRYAPGSKKKEFITSTVALITS